MSKYYRVRTQEQWDWLMQKLEKENDKLRTVSWFAPERKPTELTPEIEIDMSDVVVFVEEPECLEYGTYEDFMNSDRSKAEFNFIEVSQMMEESRMEDYVEIKGKDLFDLTADGPGVLLKQVNHPDGPTCFDLTANSITKIGIPARIVYPKVPMTGEEKTEFDELKKHTDVLLTAMKCITMRNSDCQQLKKKLVQGKTTEEDSQAQDEFARAWADPSLIEVVEEPKYNVEVPETGGLLFYVKNGEHCGVGKKSENNLPDQQFTEKEIIQYGLSKYRRVKAPK